MLPTNIATPGNPKISEDNRIEWTLSFPYKTIPTARQRHAGGRACHCYNLETMCEILGKYTIIVLT